MYAKGGGIAYESAHDHRQGVRRRSRVVHCCWGVALGLLGVLWRPVPAIAQTGLGDALDAPTLEWTTGGDASWFVQTGYPSPALGTACARSGPLIDGQFAYLETSLDGPVSFSFSWRIGSEADHDYLTLFIDGVPRAQISGQALTWKRLYFGLPDGPHTVRWEYRKDAAGTSGYDAAWLDEFKVLADIPLPQALDNTDLTWSTGGDAPWFGQVGVQTWEREHAAQSGGLGDGQHSWLETSVAGPGVLSFQWSLSSEADRDLLSLSIDGVPVARVGGIWVSGGWESWSPQEYALGAGSHTVRWVYEKDASGSAGNDCGWVDKVLFTPEYVPLADALNPALPWTTGGEAEWLGRGTLPAAGFAQSGAIGDGGSTWIQTVVTGPGVIAFEYKISSQDGDRLVFSNDGATLAELSGIDDVWWLGRNFVLGDGVHALRWEYRKDGAGIYGKDLARVRNVVFAPGSGDLGAALDNTQLTWTTGSDAGWAGQTAVRSFGTAAAQCGAVGDNGFSFIETTITGPALLSFSWYVISEAGKDVLRVLYDGAPRDQISGQSSFWGTKSVLIPAGDHVVRWEYRKDGANSWGLDSGWLDHVVVTPTVPLADALDGAGLVWTSGGDGPWGGVISTGGADSAQSAWIDAEQSSWVETTVNGPGVLTYSFTVQSHAENDFLRLLLDGSAQQQWSGQFSQTGLKAVIGDGPHTLRWEFRRGVHPDETASLHTCWLDQVAFTPGLPLATALGDTPGIAWASGGDAPWIGLGPGMARSGSAVAGQTSWLEASVTGPGFLFVPLEPSWSNTIQISLDGDSKVRYADR